MLILFSCLCFFLNIKSLSKVISLLMWGKINSGRLGNYGLRQGKILCKIFKSPIKLYFSYFLFNGFPFCINFLSICERKYISAIEGATVWNREITLQEYQITYQIILLLSYFLQFSFYIKKFIKYLFMQGKRYVGHWCSYILKQGNLFDKKFK